MMPSTSTVFIYPRSGGPGCAFDRYDRDLEGNECVIYRHVIRVDRVDAGIIFHHLIETQDGWKQAETFAAWDLVGAYAGVANDPDPALGRFDGPGITTCGNGCGTVVCHEQPCPKCGLPGGAA